MVKSWTKEFSVTNMLSARGDYFSPDVNSDYQFIPFVSTV